MIDRDRLLLGLEELLEAEEGMVTLYANFSKAVVAETEGLDEGKRQEITKLLTRLYRDSSRHKEIVNNLIGQVRTSTRNEY